MALSGTLVRLLDEAVDEARGRRETLTTIHALFFLLADRGVQGALAAARVDRSCVRADVAEALASGVGEDPDIVQRVVQAAVVRVAGTSGSIVTPLDGVIAMVDHDTAAGQLLRRHLSPFDLKWYAAHGAGGRFVSRWLRRRRATPTSPRVDILMFDDDFTPKDFVVRVLTELVGLDAETAASTMNRVHGAHAGIVVAEWPRDEAPRLIEQVSGLARTHGYPLRIEAGGPTASLPKATLRR